MPRCTPRNSRGLDLDPRTKLWILLVSNILLFTKVPTALALSYVAVLGLFLAAAHCYRNLARFVFAFAALVFVQSFVLPISPRALIALFSIFVNYTLKMLPCLMSALLMVQTSSLHDMVLAMRKLRFPQPLIVTLSVTIRYFPAIFEELRRIRNAIKLRSIPRIRRFEAIVVPMMMSATTTVEELSAAAVTRGIENPARKTSIRQLAFTWQDYGVFLVESLFLILALWMRKDHDDKADQWSHTTLLRRGILFGRCSRERKLCFRDEDV